MSFSNDDLGPNAWVRRDCEPHRGPLLHVLAWVSIVLSVFSCTGLPILAATPLALTVYWMARHDLRLIGRGLMDPDGLAMSRAARDNALLALVIVFVLSSFTSGLFLLTGLGR